MLKTILLTGLGGIVLVVLGFAAYTAYAPYHMYYDGEVPVGFYRLQVVRYDITDYGGRGTVSVLDRLGGPQMFASYLINGRPGQ